VNLRIPVPDVTSKEILDELERIKPSSEPSYWAKSSCKDCHGRGIVGTVTSVMKGNNKVTQQLVCACTRKRFQKWRDLHISRLEQEAKGPKPTAAPTVETPEVESTT
jgi:hypothetical protein